MGVRVADGETEMLARLADASPCLVLLYLGPSVDAATHLRRRMLVHGHAGVPAAFVTTSRYPPRPPPDLGLVGVLSLDDAIDLAAAIATCCRVRTRDRG
ncbi:MAG: hypothetical protein KIT14_18555 [bacterium]|nr:hypothetical protein [bacterium]